VIYAIGTPGQVVRMFIDVPSADALAHNLNDGERAVEVKAVGDFVISQSGTEVEARPVPLDEARAALWEAVKSIREKAEAAGCNTPWGVVQTDTESQSLIATAAMSGVLADGPYQRNWTFADNSRQLLDASQLKLLNSIVQTHVEACRTRANELRDVIYSTNDLAAINVHDGWP
jgi:hypothetical protein